MKKYVALTLCLLLCISLMSCGKKEAPKKFVPVPTTDIIETATANGHFSTLVTAITTAGLTETLKGPGPFTVFAPADSAFSNSKLPAGTTVESLLSDAAKLKNVLQYHVVAGKYMAADLAKMKKVATVLGDSLTIMAMPDGKIMVNDANVVTGDIMAKNGVIFMIDKVIIPAEKK